MRVTRSLAIPALALALLTGCSVASAVTQGVGTPTPSPSIASPADRCEEDEPCWDCTIHGNRICGLPDTPANATTRAAAWDAWDAHEGWHLLRVNPDKEVYVDVIGYSLSPSKDYLSLPGAGGYWYMFDAR